MPRKSAKKKRGRPKKKIDLEILKKVCSLQCTDEEIASFFDVHVDTIRNRKKEEEFFWVYKKGKNLGKISLRRTLWQHAQRNPGAAIFLSKNLLGYTDKVEQPHDIKEDKEDWLSRTTLSDGSYLVVPAGTDPVDAYHAHIRAKESKEP